MWVCGLHVPLLLLRLPLLEPALLDHVAHAQVLLAVALLHLLDLALLALVLGLLLGVGVGLLAALSLALMPPIRPWLLPILVISQAIPIFALAPLLLLPRSLEVIDCIIVLEVVPCRMEVNVMGGGNFARRGRMGRTLVTAASSLGVSQRRLVRGTHPLRR